MRNSSIFIEALSHMKNRQTLQGLNGHATLRPCYFWRIIFGPYFSSSFNIGWPSNFCQKLTNLTPLPFCKPLILNKQGKSEGFDSCDRPSSLTQIGLKLPIFRPSDLEIWWITPKNNKARLLYYIKLCVSFQIHQWIQTGVTVWKRPIWMKFDDFF